MTSKKISNKNNCYDAILVGAGIMSGTLALLKAPVLSLPGAFNFSTTSIFISGKTSESKRAKVLLIIPAPTKTASK